MRSRVKLPLIIERYQKMFHVHFSFKSKLGGESMGGAIGGATENLVKIVTHIDSTIFEVADSKFNINLQFKTKALS